jgi:hypothetical protein
MNKKQMSYRPYSLRLILLLGILAATELLPAQDTKVVRDLQLWTGAAIEKTWKDWSLTLNEEIRFKQNISEINNYFTEAGLRYRINKNFALEGGYRFTRDRNSDGSYDNLTRYNLDLRFRARLDQISIYYRLRYQKEVEGFNLIDPTVDYEKYVRNRIRLRYNKFMRIKPYVSAELFQQFRPDTYSKLEYIRVLGGIRYEAGKAGLFNVAFGFNREFEDIDPAMIYQFKVNYTYQF